MKKTPFRFSSTAALLTAALTLCAFMPRAEAGFEFKGPISASPNAAPAPAAAQSADGFPAPVMWNNSMSQDAHADTAAMPADKIQSVETAPVGIATMQAPPATDSAATAIFAQPETKTAPEAKAAPAGAEILSGFGSGIPLAIALQQVVPAGYQYSFGVGVSPGAAVSWQGGKPWQQVLTDMLSPKDLGYAVQGNVIVISKGASAPAPVAASAPTAAFAPAGNAPQLADNPAAPGVQPVTIRRQKPSALLKRQRQDAQPLQIQTQPQTEVQPVTPDKPSLLTAPPAALAPLPLTAPQNTPVISSPPADETQAAPLSPPPAEGSISPASAFKPETAGSQTVISQAETSNPPAKLWASTSTSPLPLNADIKTPTAPVAAAPVSPVAAAPMVNDNAAASPNAQQAGLVAEPTWQAAQGQTLRDVLKNWSDVAGVQLYWSIDYDYRLTHDVAYSGTYDDAIGHLLDQFAKTRPQPYGQLHQADGGPRVLVVKSYDVTP